jgi:hypothetical protein
MILAEKTIPQGSIPYLTTKGMLLTLQEQQLDAHHLWNKLELVYDRGWKVPETHSFYSLYIGDK